MDGTKIEVPSQIESSNPWTKNKSQPWGSPSTPAIPCSLEDVMSEELIKTIQVEEERASSPNDGY